jgi:hypothetical protein
LETSANFDNLYDDDGGVDVDIDTTSDESSDNSSNFSNDDSNDDDDDDDGDGCEEQPQLNVVYDDDYEFIYNSGSEGDGEGHNE